MEDDQAVVKMNLFNKSLIQLDRSAIVNCKKIRGI